MRAAESRASDISVVAVVAEVYPALWQVKKQLSVHRDCKLLPTLPGLPQQFYIMGSIIIATQTSSPALRHPLRHPCLEVMC